MNSELANKFRELNWQNYKNHLLFSLQTNEACMKIYMKIKLINSNNCAKSLLYIEWIINSAQDLLTKNRLNAWQKVHYANCRIYLSLQAIFTVNYLPAQLFFHNDYKKS